MKRQRKLAVIGIRGFPGVQGGVENHCLQLLPRIARTFDVHVFRRKPYLTDESYVEMPGIKFTDTASTRIKGFEALWHSFESTMRLIFSFTDRPSIINIHNIGPGVFTPLLRLAGYKVVLTYHSPNYEHDKWSYISKQLLRLSEKIALSTASYIIFVSSVQRAKYPQRILQKSSVIPNGITPIPCLSNTDYIESLGLKPNRFILAVGRLTPEKGFDDLILAVNMLQDSEARLVIAGSSDHNTEYIDYLKSLDSKRRTIFTGYIFGDPLAQLYSHASLFVLSSHNEGFPIVLLEAMSHRLPIVATDIPAAHIIPLPERNYCRDADPADMAKTITNVLCSDERPSYDLSAYDWDYIAAQTSEIYESLMLK